MYVYKNQTWKYSFKHHPGVIPAQAGIHKKIVQFQQVGMDPRLRGDDTQWGHLCIILYYRCV